MAYAHEQGWLNENPATKLGLEGAATDAAPLVRPKEGEPLDFREFVATLDAIDRLEEARPLSPWPSIYRLCALTGMRPTVIEGLAWEELDLGQRPMLNLPASRSKLKTTSGIPLSNERLRPIRMHWSWTCFRAASPVLALVLDVRLRLRREPHRLLRGALLSLFQPLAELCVP